MLVIIMYMLLLQLSYISLFASESRVARNTILIQRDVMWTGKIYDGPGDAVMKEEDLRGAIINFM